MLIEDANLGYKVVRRSSENVLISKLMRTSASKHVFTKMLFSNNTSVLKEYKGSYGLYTRFE